MRYQPKGSMCSVCKYKFSDCSKKDFKSMKKMPSGGSNKKSTKGSYYLCGCGEEHEFDYDTGELK